MPISSWFVLSPAGNNVRTNPCPRLLLVRNQERRSGQWGYMRSYDISRLGRGNPYSSERQLPDSSQWPEFRSHAADGGLRRP